MLTRYIYVKFKKKKKKIGPMNFNIKNQFLYNSVERINIFKLVDYILYWFKDNWTTNCKLHTYIRLHGV